jgi:threonine dehydrogenase-like Zn-dependent dehydrogenase
MRAVRNASPTVEVVEIDEPEGDGVLVRVAATGICASDLNYLRYGSTQIAGHEFAGTLEDGTTVAVEAIFGCGACLQCEQGNFNRCERGVQGLGMTDPGAMCEWFRAPRRALVPLPPGLAVQDASLVGPASVARHACHMGEIGPNTRVAVVGAGAIGILAAASAQAMGAPEVAMVARHPHQHEARERLGTGQPTSGIYRAVELARPGATVVHLGVYGDITWPMQETFMKEVALRPSLGYCGHLAGREFAESADMLAARPELVKMLITHRFPIEDAPKAFMVAQDRSNGVFRVVVEP